jgi:hypothetical protein
MRQVTLQKAEAMTKFIAHVYHANRQGLTKASFCHLTGPGAEASSTATDS